MAGGSRRVFVHVGLPKTGTTFLQDLMREHRAALWQAGVCYPDDGHRDHFFAALDARGDHRFAGAERPAARGAWSRLVELASACDGVALVGHEVLATASAERASAALAGFKGREVHVVATARDPARQVVADWQESVKHGRRHRFGQYLRHAGLVEEPATEAHDGAPFRGQRLADVLEHWGGGLPPDRVHVVTVPPSGAEPGLLWRRFASVIGVPDPDRFAPGASVRSNPSLGVAEIELLRRVGGFLDGRLVGSEFGAVAKNYFAQELLPQVSRSAPPVLPRDSEAMLGALADQWITTIAARGYDVCGDLEELRPRPAQGPAPDAWQPDDVIDTAAAATAELLLEVARLHREVRDTPGGRAAPRRLRSAVSRRTARLLRR